MKLSELKRQVDELVNNELGDVEVLDENRIVIEQVILDGNKGENVAIMCHGQNPMI